MKDKLETRLAATKARSMPLGRRMSTGTRGRLLAPPVFHSLSGRSACLLSSVQRPRQKDKKSWWVDAKEEEEEEEEEEEGGSQEGNVAFVLPASSRS